MVLSGALSCFLTEFGDGPLWCFMTFDGQKQFVLVASLGLSALLAGCFLGGMVMWHRSQEELRDPEFLRRQLELVDPASDGPANGPPKALIRVGTAERKCVQPQRSIIGRLVEVQKVTIASEVTGKIVAMPVEEGTAVVASETLLARIDDVWSRLALARSQSQVACTDVRLRHELSELKRYQELSRGNAISESELEAKRVLVLELQANLAEAKAAVQEEQERQERSEIRASFDGVVVAKHAELGGHVVPGTPIVDIVSRGRVDALLMVPESVVNRIEVGGTLPIYVDPLDQEEAGTVVSVTPYGPSASRTFPVRVRLDDQGGRLKVGMSVTALVATGPEREALVVPKDAVLVRPDGSTLWVAVRDEDRGSDVVYPLPVTLTVRLEDEYAVEPETDQGRELLGHGATVVIEGAERLVRGQEVTWGETTPTLRKTAGRSATPSKVAGRL